MLKCGNRVHIVSDHRKGGFELKLIVSDWAKDKREPWTFEIEPRSQVKKGCGTKVTISDLYESYARKLVTA
jgi:hypothetical protein